ncbi:hypothetical protein JCM8097_002694 [Rhodosporidiobolus ruineniae]
MTDFPRAPTPPQMRCIDEGTPSSGRILENFPADGYGLIADISLLEPVHYYKYDVITRRGYASFLRPDSEADCSKTTVAALPPYSAQDYTTYTSGGAASSSHIGALSSTSGGSSGSDDTTTAPPGASVSATGMAPTSTTAMGSGNIAAKEEGVIKEEEGGKKEKVQEEEQESTSARTPTHPNTCT